MNFTRGAFEPYWHNFFSRGYKDYEPVKINFFVLTTKGGCSVGRQKFCRNAVNSLNHNAHDTLQVLSKNFWVRPCYWIYFMNNNSFCYWDRKSISNKPTLEPTEHCHIKLKLTKIINDLPMLKEPLIEI